MRRALAIAAAFVGRALAGPVASASALDVALIEDRILDPEAHARITYENTVNVASYQQDGVLTYNGWQFVVAAKEGAPNDRELVTRLKSARDGKDKDGKDGKEPTRDGAPRDG